jgi:putative hydrolase of HD superfamily
VTDDEHRDPAAEATVSYLHETGYLKRLPRAGWQLPGIVGQESVADHSYRVAIVAYVLALMEGADPERTAVLGLFHDVAEARIGDVPSIGRKYVTTAHATVVVADQTDGMPETVAEPIRAAVAEFEAKETLEARCAKDADKLECLLQGLEYRAAGNPLAQPWIDTMVDAVSTPSGKLLAQTALKVGPEAWWYETAASYGKNPAKSGE